MRINWSEINEWLIVNSQKDLEENDDKSEIIEPWASETSFDKISLNSVFVPICKPL